jgi:hypothetical protein
MSGIDPVTLEKTELMKELSSLYIVRTATPLAVLQRMRLLEKKYAWRAVVGGTYALKGMLDITVSTGELKAIPERAPDNLYTLASFKILHLQ